MDVTPVFPHSYSPGLPKGDTFFVPKNQINDHSAFLVAYLGAADNMVSGWRLYLFLLCFSIPQLSGGDLE
jgi:hypothetical protein